MLLVLFGMALGVGGAAPAPNTGGTGTPGDRSTTRRPGSAAASGARARTAGDGALHPSGRPHDSDGGPGPASGLSPATQPLVAEAWRAAARRAGGPAVPVVTGSAPVQLTIDRLGISAGFERLGLNGDGTMQVPREWAKVGWYAPGVAPGDPGRTAAIVAGHVDSDSGPAVFYRLHEVRRGDIVLIRRADSTTATFVVERSEHVPKRAVGDTWLANPDGHPVLRLITCAGTFDPEEHAYQDNLIVYARLLP